MTDRTQRHDRRIVVGVDGSHCSKTALRWAITQARLSGATVEAVSAWQEPVMPGYPFGWVPSQYEGHTIAGITEKVLRETVTEVTDQLDEPVDVATRIMVEHPAAPLRPTIVRPVGHGRGRSGG